MGSMYINYIPPRHRIIISTQQRIQGKLLIISHTISLCRRIYLFYIIMYQCTVDRVANFILALRCITLYVTYKDTCTLRRGAWMEKWYRVMYDNCTTKIDVRSGIEQNA